MDSRFGSNGTCSRTETTILRITGITTLVCAALGVKYYVTTLSRAYALTFSNPDVNALLAGQPRLRHVFFVLSFSGLAFCLALLALAIPVIMRRRRVILAYCGVMAAEVLFSLVSAVVCSSIGAEAVFGLALGGVGVQTLTIVPVWGPALLFAMRRGMFAG